MPLRGSTQSSLNLTQFNFSYFNWKPCGLLNYCVCGLCTFRTIDMWFCAIGKGHRVTCSAFSYFYRIIFINSPRIHRPFELYFILDSRIDFNGKNWGKSIRPTGRRLAVTWRVKCWSINSHWNSIETTETRLSKIPKYFTFCGFYFNINFALRT